MKRILLIGSVFILMLSMVNAAEVDANDCLFGYALEDNGGGTTTAVCGDDAEVNSSTVVTGRFSNALNFTTNNHQGVLPGSNVWDYPDTNGSISGWVNFNDVTASCAISSSYDGGGFGTTEFLLYAPTSNLKLFYSNEEIDPNTAVSNGVWNLFVMRWDNDNIELFWNNVSQGNVGFTATTITEGWFAFGRAYDPIAGDGSGWECDAAFDDVKLYDRKLYAVEVGALYSDNPPPPPPAAPTYTASFNMTTNLTNGAFNDNPFNVSVTGAIDYTYSGFMNNSELILYHKFDVNDTSISHDSTVNGQNGTVTGANWNGTAGYTGGAYDFDGAGDYIRLNDTNTIFTQNDTWSFVLWAYPTIINSSDNQNRMLNTHRGSTAGSAFNLAFGASDESQFQYYDGTGFNTVRYTGATLNTWQHLAVTYDGADFDIYFNGVLVNTSTDTFGGFGSYDTFVGAQKTDTNFFYGVLDELRIYNLTLSEPQISAIYNSTTPLFACTLNANSTQVARQDKLNISLTNNLGWDTTGIEGNYSLNVTCTDEFLIDTEIQAGVFIDTVIPISSSSLVNNTIYYINLDTIIFNLTASDPNLFATNFTLFRLHADGSINATINNSFTENLNYTTYTLNYSRSASANLSVGRYEARWFIADSHTDYKVRGIDWITHPEVLIIDDDIIIDGPIKPELTTFALSEDETKYKFKLTFKNDALQHTFNITAKENLVFLPNSKYAGHFVYLPKTRWIDLISPNINNLEIEEIKPNIFRITAYMNSLTDEIEFESIGDLNIVETSYFFNVSEGFTFYAQDAINSAVISNLTVSIYNGSTLLQSKNAPGANITFNITSGEFLTNITAAGYAPNSTSNITFSAGGTLTYSLFAENSLYLFFYDESTNLLITNNVSVDVIGPSSANNYTTTSGSLFISGFDTGDYEINYNGVAYQQNAYFTTIATSTTQQLNLYLVNNETSSLIVFSILDEKSNPVSNGTLKRQRFIVPLNAWVLVGMSKTDSNGETGMYLIPNDVFYKFVVENSAGTTIFAGSQQQIYASTVFLRVPILDNILTSMVVIRDSLVGNLSYNNNTQIVSFIWNEPTGVVIRGCIDVLERNAFTETVHGPSCANSNSGTVTINLTNILKNNTQYLARAYVDMNTTSSQYHVGMIEIVANEPWKRFGNIGLFVSYIFIASMFLLGIPVNFSIALVYSIISMLVVQILGISFFSQGAIIIISVIGFIIAAVNKI